MKRRSTRVRGPRGMMLPADAAPDWVNPPEGAPPAVRADRKALQLCRQVGTTLEQVLAEQEDDALRDLRVEDVAPAPDGSHLLVTVRPLAAGVDPIAVLGMLSEATGRLRTEIASAITRRRAPALTFRVVPAGEPLA